MNNKFLPEEMELAAFEKGGLVRETGLAVVHEGEYVVPAEGSAAKIEPAQMSARGVVNYYFPVEIVVVGGIPEHEQSQLEARVWENLGDALERMT